jgi:hypothetical protein
MYIKPVTPFCFYPEQPPDVDTLAFWNTKAREAAAFGP